MPLAAPSAAAAAAVAAATGDGGGWGTTTASFLLTTASAAISGLVTLVSSGAYAIPSTSASAARGDGGTSTHHGCSLASYCSFGHYLFP